MDEFFLEATSAVHQALPSAPPAAWHGHVFSSQVRMTSTGLTRLTGQHPGSTPAPYVVPQVALRQDSKHRPMDLRVDTAQTAVTEAAPQGPWAPALMAGSALAARIRQAIKVQRVMRKTTLQHVLA